MKAQVYDLEGKKTKTIDLPVQFFEEIRQDLVMRTFLAYQSHNRQPYGAYTKAGQRASAELSRRRRDFKTAYGHGISRIPRKSLWHRGTQFGWVGAFAPGTVGGRKAHAPKSQKIWFKKINKKERRKALRSALAASVVPELIKSRGHLFLEAPLILDSKMESINKTKNVEILLEKLKLEKELERISQIKIRAGRGKSRGRRYITKKGPLFVVSNECPLIKSARNIPGIDICTVENINIALLAPGGTPGRLTIYSENAIDKIKSENLFLNIKKLKELPKEIKKEIKEQPKKKENKPKQTKSTKK